MQTFTEIIAGFGDKVLAERLIDAKGEPVGRAAVALWKHRKSIPIEYWPQVVALAKGNKKLRRINADLLMGIAAKQRRAA